VKERRGRAKKKGHVTARDVLDQWQKAPQAQPAAGVAIAEKGTHFPFIKTELASRFFRLLVETLASGALSKSEFQRQNHH
jgi:hypothetical protein